MENNQECKWLPFPDNKPRRNTLCVCKVKHRINSATDYRIAFWGEKPAKRVRQSILAL